MLQLAVIILVLFMQSTRLSVYIIYIYSVCIPSSLLPQMGGGGVNVYYVAKPNIVRTLEFFCTLGFTILLIALSYYP